MYIPIKRQWAMKNDVMPQIDLCVNALYHMIAGIRIYKCNLIPGINVPW